VPADPSVIIKVLGLPLCWLWTFDP